MKTIFKIFEIKEILIHDANSISDYEFREDHYVVIRIEWSDEFSGLEDAERFLENEVFNSGYYDQFHKDCRFEIVKIYIKQ